MKRLTRISTSALAFFLGLNPLFAGEPPSFIQFVRPLGMGGAFTAVADDHNSFFFNPAGMVQRTGGQFTLLEVAGGVNKDALDLKDYLDDNKNKLTKFDTLTLSEQQAILNDIDTKISRLDSHVYVAADIASYVSGPRFLGLPLHVGYGAFALADAQARLDLSAVKVPQISYSVNGDAVLPVSIAHRWDAPWKIPGRLAIGLTGKFLRRGQVKQENISVTLLDNLDVPDPSIGHGFGGDLGVLYQPTDRTNIGYMVQDIGGTKLKFDAVEGKSGFPAVAKHTSIIRPRSNIGVAVVPAKLLWLFSTNDRWTLSADVRDLFAEDQHLFFQEGFRKVLGENLGTHVHLGAEFKYWFLRFRGGAYQGYPSFGLGVDIPILKLDYAYYSRELGPLAGDRQEKNHVISAALRFGAGSTESRERIKKAKESQKISKEAVPETESVAPVSSSSAPVEQESPAQQAVPQ